MKRILLCLMLLLSSIAGAQIVDIPDPLFKEMLINGDFFMAGENGNDFYVDVNNDGEIQVSEAEQVWTFSTGTGDYDAITSMVGIEAFTNIRTLYAENMESLNSLDVSALTYLENLYCSDGSLDYLNVAGLSNLTMLDCSNNTLSELDLTGLSSLEELWVAYNELESLSFDGLINLEEIYADGLEQLTELSLGYLPSLEKLILGDSPLSELDASGCPSLIELSLYETVMYLNIKNGTSGLNFNVTPNLQYLCIDENEIEDGDVIQAIENGVIVNSYCTFTPGGDYNTIAGTLTFDADNDGCGGDDSLNTFVKMNIDDGTDSGLTFTNLSGEYSFFTQTGTFIITPEFENDWFTATPASATVTLNIVDNSTTTENFCITSNGVHPDVEVLILPWQSSQPGFDSKYKVVYRNNGNQVLSGTVNFSYDDAVLDYVSASPVEDNVSGSTLEWSYTGLMPFESRSAIVTLNVNGPMETPAVNIDDVLEFSASSTPTANDETPDNNSVVYNETVTGSYDPNDKTCLEGAAITPAMIGEYLHYNINFENTGTAPATFIVVKDVINPEQFDISTLQVLNASHEMMVKVEGNTVEFLFDAIDLDPLEKGNVLFKVKTLNTLQVGDEVSNYADIFFDYNFPITTNDAVTTFEVLGTEDFTVDSSVKVYPNPSKGIVTISADNSLTSVALYDIQGRLLLTAMPNHTETILNIADRAAAVYFIKVTSEKGSKVEKIIKE